jgi:putative ABC transport system permease protein
MIGNYLTVALRNLIRHKLYSFINIAGLTVGLACVIFITLFIRDEVSYDKWVPNSDNLYRVDVATLLPGGRLDSFALAPFPLPAFMKDHLPDVTAMIRLWPRNTTVQVGNRQFLDVVSEADTNFFTVLGLPLAAGDPGQVLQRPESIVLSENLARKYFGTADAIGRQVVINRINCGRESPSADCLNVPVSLRVTGVMRNLPHNTQFKIDAVIPNTSPVDFITEEGKKNWFGLDGYGFVRLAPGGDPGAVSAKLDRVMDRMLDFSPDIGMHTPASKIMHVTLVRLRDVHLNTSDTLFNQVPPGSWATVYGLGLIGLVILLAACFNFTNLATARATMRAREIGLRKCVGASRLQIATQFLGESVLMALVALVFALAAVEILLPTYDRFLERPIEFSYFRNWQFVLSTIAIAVMAGLVSGLYPALVLSGFRPAGGLRSNQPGLTGSGRLRSVLVVLQFAASIGLAVTTLVVFVQINFARNQALGFRHDNIVVIHAARMAPTTRDSFMAQLRTWPDIAGAATSGGAPFSLGVNFITVTVPGQAASLSLERLLITPQFLSLYGMNLAAGRFLSDKRGEDAVINRGDDAANSGHNVLINEAAAGYLGFTTESAPGKTIYLGKSSVRIVGVLRNVKFRGARQAVRPTLFFNDKLDSSDISVRLSGQDIPGAVGFIDRTWHRMAPSVAISRTFLDDSFDQLYRTDVKQGTLFGIFVAIAIFISCLGLFGLAAFSTERRTREIGLRKTFGASTSEIIWMLLGQFSVPVLIANAIAWPVAWYYLHNWLQGFAYRIPLSPLYFLGAGAVALIIAWATVFVHARRVANASPIHALRTE